MDNNNMFNQGQNDSQGQQNQQNYQGQQDYQSQQSFQNQQPYQQAPYQQSGVEMEEPVSFGEWMLTMLIMMIPCVNIIMMFVWAFGDGKKSKSNYFKASLVWALISIVVTVIIVAVFGAAIVSGLSSAYYY